jgi:DNA-binding NtrC family response regulator
MDNATEDHRAAAVPHSILIVDDEQVVCDALARHLVKAGFDVTVAYQGSVAIELLGTKRFDLGLIDIRMPRVTGFDVLEALKKLQPAAKAIMMTAYADIKSAVELISRGAVDLVSKPVDTDEVILAIRRCLEPSQNPPP